MKRKTGNKQQKAPSLLIRQAGIQNLLFSLAKYNF